jgi:hypothetical protein
VTLEQELARCYGELGLLVGYLRGHWWGRAPARPLAWLQGRVRAVLEGSIPTRGRPRR